MDKLTEMVKELSEELAAMDVLRHWFGSMGKDRYLVEKSMSYGVS